MTTLNVLFTSVGRRVELVRAFRSAFATLGIDGTLCATDIDRLAPAFQEIDRAFLVPPFDSPDFIARIVDICANESIDLVLPLIDPDIPVLSRHKSRIEKTGAIVGVVNAGAAAICSDKWLTQDLFRQVGVPTPESWLPGDRELADIQFPVFIRPRRGSAGSGAFKVHTRRELEFFAEYIAEPIVQEFLPGPEITSDVVCDFAGNVMAVVSRRRIAVRGGEAIKSVTVRDERIIQACCGIARQLPALGPITVQCMMKDDEPYFIEINGRLGGGVPLAVAAGVDVPVLLLAATAGEPINRSVGDDYLVDLYMTRCDNSFFLTGSQVDSIAGDSLRSG